MSYNDLFNEAIKHFDNGNYEDAEALLRQISITAPDNPEVLNMLGLIAQAKGLHSQACPLFSAALRIKPDTASYCFNLAFSLKALGQYSEALDKYNKVLSLAPAVVETHNEIACIYENQNQLDKARMHWQTALQMNPDYTTAKINLANSYRFDNPAKAIEDLILISAQYPNEAAIWYNLSWLYFSSEEFIQALKYAQKAIILAPQSDTAHYLLGLCFLHTNDISSAKKHFLHSEEINTDNFDAKLCLADIYSRENQFDKAETRYKRLIELNPSHYGCHNNYAEMLTRQNRFPEALEECRKAVILAPNFAEVSNNLGAILREIGEYREALGLFFNALSLNPDLKEASLNIWETLVLFSATNEDEALKIALNWQKSYPNDIFANQAVSALKGDNIANNKIFTEQLFDNFADNYEVVMQNLDYSAPLAIRRIAGNLEGRIVDLGCGSGLVGVAVKKASNYLIGVDISEQMLKKAANKNIYSELIKSDIIEFLTTRQDYDWLIAADVLCYMGDLHQFFALSKNKNLIFTIEYSDNENFQIQNNGRFKHNPSYIEHLLALNQYNEITKEEIILRTENQEQVKGIIYKAIRKD